MTYPTRRYRPPKVAPADVLGALAPMSADAVTDARIAAWGERVGLAGAKRPATEAQRTIRDAERTRLEDALARQLYIMGVPEPAREYRFDAKRQWRFDFAWPGFRVAVEVEGGLWTSGRHTRPAGFRGDVAKYNAATLAGWAVLRVTADMIDDGSAVGLVEEAVHGRR